MDNLTDKIKQTFNVNELSRGAFYNFAFGLRFELGGEIYPNIKQPIPRFLQAMERATSVANMVFENTNNLIFFISMYGDKDSKSKSLKKFKYAGFKKKQFTYLGGIAQADEDHIEEYGEDIYHHWYAYEIKDKKQIAALLWLPIAQEMPIEPCICGGLSAYFVDFESQTFLHPYDDRGMDLISMNKHTLKPIYDEFYDWLLDYDLKEMNQVFSDELYRTHV